LPRRVWQEWRRRARHEVATRPRARPANVKQGVVVKKGYTDLRLVGEQVAEFNYRPGACRQDYLVVVLRKHLVIQKKGQQLGEEVRYFFYITNQWTWGPSAVVDFANDRANQKRLIADIRDGVRR